MNYKIYRLALGGELISPPYDIDGSYHYVEDLLGEINEPSIILLDGLKQNDDKILKEAFEAVYQLRQSALFYAAPIFLTKSMGKLDAFVDGIGKTSAEILPYASEILARMRNISIEENAGNEDLRLLTYLFCRGDEYCLSPSSLVASPWIYEYPAAFLIGGYAGKTMQTASLFAASAEKDAFNLAVRSSTDWIASLDAHGFLDTAGLVDRIRICPYCHTGKLNYIDSCPVSGSIDFIKTKMVHCFTCGHVAPEENFRNGMMLICPRCNTTLRHIGSDYDRPLETYICNDCGERFIEPVIKAHCLNCRQKSAPEDLEVRQIFNYSLTAKGKRAVQFGRIDFEFSLFDNNRNVLPIYFYQVADWLLQMKHRYSDEDFSLLCIKIVSPEAVDGVMGVTQYKNLIDELATRIRELVRQTDITTSTGTNTFWLLLPRTNEKGGEILASRIEKLAEMVSLGNGAHFKIIVKCLSIPVEYANRGPVAETLISEYEANLLDVR